MAGVQGKFILGRGCTFCLNFLFTGSIREIDSSITDSQLLLSISPLSHPRRPLVVHGLALKQLERHKLSNQRDDLDKGIGNLAEGILLLPGSPITLRQVALDSLLFLADALFMRSKISNQPEDAIYAAKYLSYLRDQPYVPYHHMVTTMLVNALDFQVGLDAGDVMQNIREMAVLCRELFTSQTSYIETTRLVVLLYGVVTTKICPGIPDQPLDELIECLRVAREHRPDLLEGRLAIGISLAFRYLVNFMDDDYDEAASILDEIITSRPPGDGQDKFEAEAQGFATMLVTIIARLRSYAYQTPEYLEEAIYLIRALLSSAFVKDRSLPTILDLEDTANERFRHFGSIEGLGALSDNSLSSQTVPGITEDGEDECDLKRTDDEMESLLFEIRNNDDMTKVDEAIERGRTILASYPQTDLLQGYRFFLFGNMLFEAFERTKQMKHLNESISARRQVAEFPFSSYTPHYVIYTPLSNALLARSLCFPSHRTQDLDEALGLLSRTSSDPHAKFPIRFQVACLWAYVARRTQHPSVSTAYETATSLMQDNLHFSPTLHLQHINLATRDNTHSMPLDHASYRVELGQLKEAIETLERGRALLWSEMHHLRASIDQLLEADPDLGLAFAAVNRDLEELTKSVPPSHKLSIDDGADDDLRAVDPFGRLVLKQRGLLKERDKLVSKIQALPDFDGFLTSPTFETLRSAASSGPVIIINHSVWRSDILILLHNMSPSLVPTPYNFYDRASAIKDKLLYSRQKYGLDSKLYDETLASVLAELYDLVGQPVIDRLRQLQVPEQSRIWWCPTSVFCSLPLHAMGPIPSDVGEPRYFLDLYICSYTPTISALVLSRHRDSDSRPSDRPSILLVAQPVSSLPTVWGENEVVQALDTEVTSLISAAATPARIIDGLHHHRFVHFACHGTLEAGKPFEAGLELHENTRLTLLEIVRAHLPAAEFAFLSACHTAELTEGSVMDEGLHLAAAVQYCGFRSVVGTMWAMVDEDGRDLAEYFYKALFSNPRGTPYHQRSAKALRFAVKKLRRKRRITLERWVNFVHYGA